MRPVPTTWSRSTGSSTRCAGSRREESTLLSTPSAGDRFLDSVRALSDGGRLLVVGFAAGTIPTLKVNRLLLRNLAVIGVNLGISSDGVHVELQHDLRQRWKDLVPLLERGLVGPSIGLELPLDRAGEALAAIESRAAEGKVVLRVR